MLGICIGKKMLSINQISRLVPSCFVPSAANVLSRMLLTRSHCSLVNVDEAQRSLSLIFSNSEKAKFHYIWLRENCQCEECYNRKTRERLVLTHKLDMDIKPAQTAIDRSGLIVVWEDGHKSTYKSNWLNSHRYGQPYEAFLFSDIKQQFWGKELHDQKPETVAFEKVVSDENCLLSTLETIEKYGFVIVPETPVTTEATRKVADVIGSPRRTIFGDVSEVTNSSEDEFEHADRAYLNVALPCHHDGTYFIDSPGVQMFHCLRHTGAGGETLLVDAIGAAERLRDVNKDAFDILSTIWLPAKYYEPGYCSRTLGPLIKVDPYSNQVYQVRMNNGDRDVTNCLSFQDMERFYDAYLAYSKILYHPDRELWFKLTPGNLLIVNNWRVMHGRSAFTGTRTLSGCYVNKDDYLSKLRVLREKLKESSA